MSQSFSLEGYSLPPQGGLAGAAEVSRPIPKKVWSRKVAADLVGVAEAGVIILGGMLPSFLYASAGAIVPAWFGVIQSSLVAALIYRLTVMPSRQYDPSRVDHFTVRPSRILSALVFAVLVATSLGAPSKLDPANVCIWAVLWVAAGYAGVILVRTAANDLLAGLSAAGRFDERVAVYGAGHIARRVHDHLANPNQGLRFVGVFDSRETPDRINPEGLLVAGGLDDLVEACQQGLIDRVIIALPQIAERRVNDITRKFEDLSVNLHIVTHLASDYGRTDRNYRVSQVGPVGLLDIKHKRLAGWNRVLKRIEDLSIALAASLVVAPIVPLIALAIKLNSPGPVLFRQRRRGINQRVFEVLKFRTMTVMEDGQNVRQATTNDVRVTAVGRILRRTSLDELPQLWNVLCGDMSLVGPRPHALVHDEKFGRMLESYANRHQMKPGVTGLAQVSGHRGETATQKAIQDRVECDLRYIRTWSLWLDFKILARTVWAVVEGTNAK